VTRTTARARGAAFAAALLLPACGPEPEPAGGDGADGLLAREHFENRCAICHGLDGKGRGPAAMSLNPPPRDWTDRDWQASVTDADLELVIREGGAALRLSPAMPASEHAGRPGVVKALVAIVRAFGG
jgi:hypothetical protein